MAKAYETKRRASVQRSAFTINVITAARAAGAPYNNAPAMGRRSAQLDISDVIMEHNSVL